MYSYWMRCMRMVVRQMVSPVLSWIHPRRNLSYNISNVCPPVKTTRCLFLHYR